MGGVQKGAGCGRWREVGWRHDMLTAYDIVAAMMCYSILFAEKNNQQRSSSKSGNETKAPPLSISIDDHLLHLSPSPHLDRSIYP